MYFYTINNNKKYLKAIDAIKSVLEFSKKDEVIVSERTICKEEPVLNNEWFGEYTYKKDGTIISSDGDSYSINDNILGFEYDFKSNVLTIYKIIVTEEYIKTFDKEYYKQLKEEEQKIEEMIKKSKEGQKNETT